MVFSRLGRRRGTCSSWIPRGDVLSLRGFALSGSQTTLFGVDSQDSWEPGGTKLCWRTTFDERGWDNVELLRSRERGERSASRQTPVTGCHWRHTLLFSNFLTLIFFGFEIFILSVKSPTHISATPLWGFDGNIFSTDKSFQNNLDALLSLAQSAWLPRGPHTFLLWWKWMISVPRIALPICFF